MDLNKKISFYEAVSLLTQMNQNTILACDTIEQKQEQLAKLRHVIGKLRDNVSDKGEITYYNFYNLVNDIFFNMDFTAQYEGKFRR